MSASFFDNILNSVMKEKGSHKAPSVSVSVLSIEDFVKVLGNIQETPDVQVELLKKCEAIMDDGHYTEQVSMLWARMAEALKKQHTSVLLMTLIAWKRAISCGCGNPEHKLDGVVQRGLLPVIREEVERRKRDLAAAGN